MLKKLTKLFPSAVVSKSRPSGTEAFLSYCWFKDDSEKLWLGIPKQDASPEQLEVISSLYEQTSPESSPQLGANEKAWREFLLYGGPLPVREEKIVRIIQYRLDHDLGSGEEWPVHLTDFFYRMEAIIPLDRQFGLIVEEHSPSAYQEEDFRSISAAFENDFYARMTFFIGKSRPVLTRLSDAFSHERKIFTHSLDLLPAESVHTFEKVFPALLASQLPEIAGKLLDEDLVPFFQEDPELLETMKIFLEHNSNVSLAAKKLYIHRNTMQYRLDRFAEKSGINLKDYPSALAVYFACLKASYQK